MIRFTGNVNPTHLLHIPQPRCQTQPQEAPSPTWAYVDGLSRRCPLVSLHLTAPALFLILFCATPPAFPLFGSHTLFRRGSGVPRRGVSRCVRPGDSGGDLWGVVNVGSREGSYLEPQISWTFLWPGHICWGKIPLGKRQKLRYNNGGKNTNKM